MSEVWTRAAAGLDTVWIGGDLPPCEGALVPLRVRCDPPTGPMGPLLEAGARAARALGQSAEFLLPPPGLSYHMMGEPPRNPLDEVVARLNALAQRSRRPRALVIEDLEVADAGTLAALERMVRRPGWLRLPLVLVVRGAPGRALTSLLAAVKAEAGPEAILEAPEALTPEVSAPAASLLPPKVRRVLRAGALVGDTFTLQLVSALLHKKEGTILDRLQQAADLGWPLAEDGDGRFRMPATVAASLRNSLLPSLARAWHLELALLRGANSDEPEAGQPEADVSAWASTDPPTDEEPVERPADPTPAVQAQAPTAADDPAAAHLLAAGETEAAVDQLISAARQAAELGAADQAFSLAGEGLRNLDELPRTPEQRRRRVALLLAIARAQHRGAGGGSQLTLEAAAGTAATAARLISDDDPVSLQVSLTTVQAQILYDLGTREALDEALGTLTDCSKRLQANGAPREAARLLNDQAAVWVRMGDPVRAHGLLDASRRVFAAHADSDPIARQELAETDLLIARLPLHVDARPGREMEAVELGIEHARAAATAYNDLGLVREEARALATIGRLELLRDLPEAAVGWLRRAAQIQEASEDTLGLAATAEALARALSATGRHGAALELIGDSLALNAEKGSAQGLDYVRRALEHVVQAMPPEERKAQAALVSQLSAELAEERGRVQGWNGEAALE